MRNKSQAKDAKDVEGHGDRKRNPACLERSSVVRSLARSLALGAARQIATGGEGGGRRRRERGGRCHRSFAISTPRDAIYRRNTQSSLKAQESCRPRAPRGLRGRRKATKGEGRSGERKSRNQPVSQGYLPPERRPRPDCSDCPSSCSGRPSSDTGWLIQSKELYQTICESRRERGGKEERRERKGRTNERGT